MQRIKELFHASADEKKAQLVSVTGIAGIGKSRLAWEFYKYFDGIAETRLLAPRALPVLRRGRDLLGARGHGAHALPDRRGGGAGVRASKLRATLEEQILDPEERGFLEPRLAHLLGLGEHRLAIGRTCSLLGGCSSSVWPRATRRCSVSRTCSGQTRSLLDFVEYLLDWSRSSPIFVVTLARPELLERRPTWGAGQRSFTSLYLEPLVRRWRWRSC